MKNPRFTFALCSAMLATPLAVQAATQSFLKIAGIPGGSTFERHENSIEITSFSWGLSVVPESGAGGVGASPIVVLADFAWTQYVDQSVPLLLQAAGNASQIAEATVSLVASGREAPYTYLSMVFEDLLLTRLSINGGSGNPAEVSGSFTYGSLEMTVTVEDNDGKKKNFTGRWEADFEKGALFTGSSLVFAQIANLEEPLDSSILQGIPEPQTYALLLAGLGLVGWAVRRKRPV